jgi:hypothetical protein
MCPTVSLSATVEKLRQEGNTYFNKGKYGAAIDKYTEVFCNSSAPFSHLTPYDFKACFFSINNFICIGFEGDHAVP